MTERYQNLTLQNIIGIAAPHTWVAAIFPVLLGSLLSYSLGRYFSPLLFVVLLAASILMQSAVNSFNDYHDFVKGNDRADNSDEPSDAVLVYNNLNPRHVRILGASFLGTALLLGCYAVWHGGWVPLLLGALGASVIIAYSSGKFPISYLPVGEAVSGFVMGALITMATYASHTRAAPAAVLLLSLPYVFGIGLIMMTNNCCDIERDSAVGRKTMPVMLGRAGAKTVYRILELLWIASLVVLSLTYFPKGWPALLLLAPGLPLILAMFRLPLTTDERGRCMGTILKMNLFLNTLYLVVIGLHTIL